MGNIKISELSEDDRPRERFMQYGASYLSVAELLAILIGSGWAEENAVQLSQRIMNDCGGSLATLGRMTVQELCKYKGMGTAKAITILASCELNRRRMSEGLGKEQVFGNSDAIYKFFLARMNEMPVEECRVLLLNNRLHYIADRVISRGGITGTTVDIRLVLKEALLVNATRIVLCHNHPSGSLTPSIQDDDLTKRVKKACTTIDICLLDHLILTDHGYYSYQDEGRL